MFRFQIFPIAIFCLTHLGCEAAPQFVLTAVDAHVVNDMGADLCDGCGDGGECRDGICICNDGYELLNGTCVDVDECLTENGDCGPAPFFSCQNNEGSPPSCSDVDECITDNGGCGDSAFFRCTNNVGAEPACEDINECEVENGGCGEALFMRCENQLGGPPLCQDIDECGTDNGGCGDALFFRCVNTVGGPPVCGDIDECGTDNGGCGDPDFYECVNLEGTAPACSDLDECLSDNGDCGDAAFYRCINQDGQAPICLDIDECLNENGGCGDPQFVACTNVTGGPPVCADIDECASANGGCGDDRFYSCTNVIGAPAVCADIDECLVENGGCGEADFFRCINNDGAPVGCIDINECETNHGGCGDPAFYDCVNHVGGPATCSDIDECLIENGGCGDGNFYSCANVDGGPPTCADIDECLVDNGGCGDASFFLCVNLVGLEADCSDIDECALDNGGCGNAEFFTCANQVGAPPLCADIDECLTDNGGCGDAVFFVCSNQEGVPPVCTDVDECLMENGGCGEVEFFSCENLEGAPPRCTDVDECLTDNGGCGDSGFVTCENQVGGAPVCQDIDECLVDNGGCGPERTTTCHNQIGMAPTCIDVDECSEGTHDCPVGTRCGNTLEGFDCLQPNVFVCDCGPGSAPGCVEGDPGNDGLSAQSPLRSLDELSERPDLDLTGLQLHLCEGGALTGSFVVDQRYGCGQSPCGVQTYAADWGGVGERPILRGRLSIGRADINETLADVTITGIALEGEGDDTGIIVRNDSRNVLLSDLVVRNWNVGIEIRGAGGVDACADGEAICRRSPSGVAIDNCLIERNGQYGVTGEASMLSIVQNQFQGNGGASRSHHHVYLSCFGDDPSLNDGQGCDDLRVAQNTFTGSARGDGDSCAGSSMVISGVVRGAVIEGNRIEEPYGEVGRNCGGIEVKPGFANTAESFTDVVLRANTVINVGGTGLGLTACQNCTIEDNVVIHEHGQGTTSINVPSGVLGAGDLPIEAITVRNNSIYISDQPSFAIAIKVNFRGEGHRILSNAIVNLSGGFIACCLDQSRTLDRYEVIDHNICLLDEANNRANWALGYSTLEDWQDIAGFGLNSIEADPLFVAPMGPDFDLSPAAGSPLVGAGHPELSSRRDRLGVERNQAPEVGAFEVVED